MARMIPPGGPNITASPKAEPNIYRRLEKLSDDFVVIHSLPWLCSAVKTLDPKYAPTGELDFVVLHPHLGILAIEVKGGKIKYDQNKFVFTKSNQTFDPVGQLRRGTFTLNAWLRSDSIFTPVGYAFIAPDSSAKNLSLPPAFQDPVVKKNVFIGFTDLPNLDKRIVEIMEYWVKTLNVRPLEQSQIDRIVDLVCPSVEYGIGWDSRIEYDNKTWLILHERQKVALDRISKYERTKVHGGPGTGKTVMAFSLARNLASEDKKVLFLVFNRRLAEKIKSELSDIPNTDVMTFHAFCFLAAKNLNMIVKDDDSKYDDGINYLRMAIQQKKLPNYDVLIIDEGQIFHRDWYHALMYWMKGKRIHVFCDETQAFSFETQRLSNLAVGELIEQEQEFLLVVNMRSPKPVFDRIEASIPTSYQQFSPRDLEYDTLDEKVTSDSEKDLIAVLGNLHSQNIAKENIAVITSSREIKSMKGKGLFERIGLLADIDTSQQVRGLEFPIVVVYGLDVWDSTLVINAYARATTRVIAIYNQAVLSGAEQEKDLFAIHLKKNPVVSDALRAPWDFLLKNMNWSLLPVLDAPNIYWHQNFGAWVIRVSRYMTIQEELWGAHLLLSTEYPVVLVRSDNEYLNVSQINLPNRTLSDSVRVNYLKLASICNLCGKYCFRDSDGNTLCCHCSKKTLTPNPTINQKILSVPLLSLQQFERLEDRRAELVSDHVKGYFGGDKKIGYQPLLIFVGTKIVDMSPGSEISNKEMIGELLSILGNERLQEISKVLPNCVNYWYMKDWLGRVDKGVYRRTNKSPLRDAINDLAADNLP